MWRFDATPRYVAALDGDVPGPRRRGGAAAGAPFTNIGRWMAHCHLAEHHESGMMFSVDVSS